MRVTFLCHASHLGGAERSLVDLVAALPESVAAHVILPRPGELSAALEGLGATWEACRHLGPIHARGALSVRVRDGLGLLHGSFAIADRIAARPPQILHANSTTAALFGLLAARRHRVPLVWHARDLALGRWSSLLGRGSRRVIAASECVRAALRARVDPAALRLIHNGIDPGRFNGPRGSRAPGQAPLVVSIGQLVPWKRHELLIRSAPEVLRRFPGTRFLIVGAEPEGNEIGHRRDLELEVTRLGLEESVVLTGQRPDVPELLARSDLLVHTAHPEPFGRAVVEAMAAGIPVVALAGAHGPAELVRDGIDGRLVHPGTHAALAAVVCDLLERPALRARMGAAARERVEAHFHRRRMAERVRSLYEEILAEALAASRAATA